MSCFAFRAKRTKAQLERNKRLAVLPTRDADDIAIRLAQASLHLNLHLSRVHIARSKLTCKRA